MSHDNVRSVLVGQTDSARVITAAAAIMIAVFITFAFIGEVGHPGAARAPRSTHVKLDTEGSPHVQGPE